MLNCKICFEAAQQKHSRARVTVCGHVFCQTCIENWFQREKTCPVCRRPIDTASQLITVYDDVADGQEAESSRRCSGEDDSKDNSAGDAGEVDNLASAFQVKTILQTVGDQWQSLLIERAQFASKAQELEEENSRLKSSLRYSESQCERLALALQQQSSGQTSSGPTGGGIGVPDLTNTPRCTRDAILKSWVPAGNQASHRQQDVDLVYKFHTHPEPIHGIAVHKQRNLVATASWDHTCKLYDLDDNRVEHTLVGHTQGLYAVAFSAQAPSVLGTVSSDQTCRLWDIDSGGCKAVLMGHEDEVNGISFHDTQALVATASDDRRAVIWDMEEGRKIRSLEGHQNVVYGVCFAPEGSMVATASFDWTAKIWDLRSGMVAHTLRGHHDDIIGVDIDDSGTLIATGSDDNTCRVWDIRTLQPVSVLRSHQSEVKRVVFSPSGALLATTSGDTSLRIFETATYSCVATLEGHNDHVFDAAWAGNGSYLVSASHDRWGPCLISCLMDVLRQWADLSSLGISMVAVRAWHLWRPAATRPDVDSVVHGAVHAIRTFHWIGHKSPDAIARHSTYKLLRLVIYTNASRCTTRHNVQMTTRQRVQSCTNQPPKKGKFSSYPGYGCSVDVTMVDFSNANNLWRRTKIQSSTRGGGRVWEFDPARTRQQGYCSVESVPRAVRISAEY
eukprot:scaffold668_cov385-Prasinococcus_capsulatus_cf.AAC.6